ncbi:MAG: NUDIX domain-containing protein [Anaerolineae bacterium]|jgi:8-oxo-dGTP pyrophosphatase MutT (NUDIX family)
MAEEIERYVAAGAVVVRDGLIVVLRWPKKGEIRLPKGHVEPGETVREAALREAEEESGYLKLEIVADLGSQRVRFEDRERRVVRTERYFLMRLRGEPGRPRGTSEPRFEPLWLPWDEAMDALTFEAEREWVRRARRLASGTDVPVSIPA